MSKRISLVAYDASSDEESEQTPAPKKRKLPSLAPSLTVPKPIDNPALHQGRVRNSPHIEGQWASYVYVPVVLGREEYLSKLLDKIFDAAKQQVPSIHSICLQDGQWELHISLTRPTFLRTHQKEDFKRTVKSMARSQNQFPVSFAHLAQLTNDENTRVFLTVEVGAGYSQLRHLTETLIPTLRAIRQQEFYSEPRFHASIAWALLDRPNGSADAEFVTIPDFPPNLVSDLNRNFSSGLQRASASFEVSQLKVKIGKEVAGWQIGPQI